jgi:hypothetical protein
LACEASRSVFFAASSVCEASRSRFFASSASWPRSAGAARARASPRGRRARGRAKWPACGALAPPQRAQRQAQRPRRDGPPIEHGLQVVREGRHVAVAAVAFRIHRRAEHEVELGRRSGVQTAQARQLRVAAREVGVAERVLQREQLPDARREREHVRALVGRQAAALLGRHVGRGSGRHAGARQVARGTHLGYAEVEHDRLAVRRDHHVGRFDVAVHDAAQVRVAQPECDLLRDADRGFPPSTREQLAARMLRRRERAQIVAAQRRRIAALHARAGLLDRGPCDELHREERHALVFAREIHRDERGMLELGDRVDLAAETLARALEVEQLGPDDLERDAAVQRLLDRFVDDAHAAAADAPQQPVLAEPFGM